MEKVVLKTWRCCLYSKVLCVCCLFSHFPIAHRHHMDHFNFDSCDAHKNSIDEENKMSFVTKDISIEININNPKK